MDNANGAADRESNPNTSTPRSNHSNTPVLAWPLDLATQRGLVERIQQAVDNRRDEAIGCWSSVTGFGLMVHIANGEPFFWECVGPMSRERAHAWVAGIEESLSDTPTMLM